MFALSSLVLTTTLCLSPPARASHWKFDVTGSSFKGTATGSTSGAPPTWSPGPATSNSFAFPSTTVTASDTPGTSNPSCTSSATLTLTLTATWVHDTTAQTDTTDPAPTKVWLVENGSAAWSGSINVSGVAGPPGANAVRSSRGLSPASAPAPTPVCTCTGYSAADGLGDPEVDTLTGTPLTGISATPAATTGATTAPPGWSAKTISGNSFTLTRTVTAKVTAAGNVPCVATAKSTISYSVSIHAQPYNLRSSGYDIGQVHYDKSRIDPANATIVLSYVWDSTDGNKADLASCQINENVIWNSNPQGVGYPSKGKNGNPVYVPPSPPAGKDGQGNPVAYLNPTILGGPATANGGTDTFSPESYFSGPPYRNVSWWGDQVYVFSDSKTGENTTPIPGPATGSFRITRTVAPIANSTTFGYTISTRGYSAGPYTLPGQ